MGLDGPGVGGEAGASALRAGRGAGAGSASAVGGGDDSISIREHPKHGFFAEGLVEVVVDNATDMQRIVGAALTGFVVEEKAIREGGTLSPGGGGGGGERAHCMLQAGDIHSSIFQIRRRRFGGYVR